MAGLKNSCYGFAYAIDDSKEGGYVLNITNSAAILVGNEVTLKIAVDLNRRAPLCPNLPYAEINVTIPIVDGTEPTIMRMQSGPKGDLWSDSGSAKMVPIIVELFSSAGLYFTCNMFSQG